MASLEIAVEICKHRDLRGIQIRDQEIGIREYRVVSKTSKWTLIDGAPADGDLDLDSIVRGMRLMVCKMGARNF